jgi:TetR/AcrR family transcriptional repressor of nem operon
MARHKNFDREEVLMKAMDVFWEKGFESTSMQDLIDAMGIGRASLYDTFGSKHELFAEAMDRYGRWVQTDFLAGLRNPGSPKKVLADFFKGAIDAFTTGEQRSCLLIKSAVATGRWDAATSDQVTHYIGVMEDTFHEVLERARQEGEIHKGANLRALARYFATCLQGMSVTSCVHRERRYLLDVARTALSVLDHA